MSVEDALQSRLAQGGAAFGVAVACATARRRAETGAAIQLGVTLRVPASTPPPLVMRFALIDEAVPSRRPAARRSRNQSQAMTTG